MTHTAEIEYILNDCLLAAGQGIGTGKPLDFEVVVWWRMRYRRFFLQAMERGNSWARDRHRVTAVGRYLGQRALHHSDTRATIDLRSAAMASHDVETGCKMNAVREGVVPAGCTNSTSLAF